MATIASMSSTILTSCHSKNKATTMDDPLKLSLAQWSLNKAFFAKELDPIDFAKISKETYGIEAVEYVNQFYIDQVNDGSFWLDLKNRAEDVGVTSLLIMVDDEGDMGIADETARKTSVENHYKWVDAAKLLGCHSIRVNAFGDTDEGLFKAAMIKSMTELSTYAAKMGINIVIENHGLHSSNAPLIVDIIKQVNMSNFGTFPDFGNWCTSAKWGSTQIECEAVYDPIQGVRELLPYAKAVSAKSYSFDETGGQSILDYPNLLKLVKASPYDGYIGIEYEGENLSEHDGIIATKKLISEIWKTI